MERPIFLPGALGAADFWRPVGGLLPTSWHKVYLGWPGFGVEPADPAVRGFDDLVELVEEELTEPATVVAQSMGGIVAIRAAVRCPEKVRALVLVATSGGVDVARLGAADWREDYRRSFPAAASWIADDRPDHGRELRLITAPTLLIWGDADPISPVAVGEHLASLLPNATLRVIPGGTHSLAVDHAPAVAKLIAGTSG
jgi:pimeloyl-ACP methyl ester carboxylesterase